MENKDTNTEYQKFVRVGGPKVRNSRNYYWNYFFIIFFWFEIRIHYFLYREFSSST